MKFYTYKVSDWSFDKGEYINISTLEELISFIKNTKETQVIIRFDEKWELIDYDDWIE